MGWYIEHPAARGEWLTNILDPSKRGAPSADYHYAKDKLLGPPKETEHYSVLQLRDMGLVGVYEKKEGYNYDGG